MFYSQDNHKDIKSAFSFIRLYKHIISRWMVLWNYIHGQTTPGTVQQATSLLQDNLTCNDWISYCFQSHWFYFNLAFKYLIFAKKKNLTYSAAGSARCQRPTKYTSVWLVTRPRRQWPLNIWSIRSIQFNFAYQLLPALFEGPVLALAVMHCKFFLSASKTIAYPGRTWPS